MKEQTDVQAAAARAPRRWVGPAVALGLVAVAGALVGVVALLPVKKDNPPPVQDVPVNVELLRVRPVSQLPDTFDLTAVVEPELVVRVAAEVPGRIERYGKRQRDVDWRGRLIPEGAALEEGEPISAGDPIVHLDEDLLRARYDQARAQHDYEEREYRRLVDLFERGSTSRTELDDARTRRDVAAAALAAAAEELERTTIVAPIDGIVNRLPMEVGEYASPGQVVAEMVSIDKVKIVVDVPERDVHYLSVGQTGQIILRPPHALVLEGEITYISELADEDTRTSRLELTVENRQHVLRSGQIVKARLTRRVLSDVIMIPLASVIPLEEGRVVYVVDDEGRAERREVELDLIKGREVRVVSGLSPGDRLIVAGHRYVGPGQTVTVIDESTTASTPPAPQQ